MSITRILLVEDDLNLSKELKQQLQNEGFEVENVYDGNTAEQLINENKYDIILADINIPGQNGYELVKGIRQQQNTVPTIIITAFDEIDDKLQGFDCGADDYITKPFFFKELLARIKAILKRSDHHTGAELIVHSDMIIDARKREVKRRDELIRLTSREYEILLMLADANGQPVSKKDILTKVWGTSFSANTNTIEVFINLLRNKIDKNFEPKLIRTRIGCGYYIGEH
ncbi:response regulator transcription factor [Taibaiella lutea]|uniref:Response regulator transcription factor n=1 Tax=Taibaiella lutea TaxID=2608001 RepID=A0A5M6CDR4_9BACT|nr:response regulator transcription factor [Taibaiella lutea]KAA5532600.1 response regulator transcription factor [Taibaiella lutea]